MKKEKINNSAMVQRGRGIPGKVFEGPLTPEKLNTYMSAISNRASLAARLGVMTYDGSRDVYQALGYPKTLTFEEHYLPQYLRSDIAKAIIDRPVRAAWRGGLSLLKEGQDGEESELEKKWNEIETKFQMENKLQRLDKLTGIGRYGVLLLGLNDVKKNEDFVNAVQSQSNKLLYVKPLSEGSAKIVEWENNPNNERFGKPLFYQIEITNENGSSFSIKVHYTRVIHIVDGILEDEVNGTPRLEAVFNRLLDIEKIVGGSAEMFWRSARPGFQGLVDKDFQLTPSGEASLQDQFDEYSNNMRRFFMLEGVEIKELKQALASPKDNVDVVISLISAETGIPKRILMGSERGELSSAQDREEWNLWVQTRRENFMEPLLVRPIINRFMELGILPKVEKYTVRWDELFAMSPKEKAEIAETISNAIRYYTATPTAEYILPKEVYIKKYLGLTKEEMEEVEKLVDEMPEIEPPLSERERIELQGQQKVGAPMNGQNKKPANGTGNDTIAKKQKATV